MSDCIRSVVDMKDRWSIIILKVKSIVKENIPTRVFFRKANGGIASGNMKLEDVVV